ncbi:hexosaminidase D-like [Hydractinia symbiolongicarpus]|uniref:hexosaminidase D-like n=1 Tax=Hydractinia symbiolongicarpus TaxID=13093 RepID=UPI00254CE068|nr:hexosaminidase D-like [Hydractinia symbiolongicarpus]
MFSNMKVTNKLDIRHVLLVIFLLVLLYWLLMTGPEQKKSEIKEGEKSGITIVELQAKINELREHEVILKSSFEQEKEEHKAELGKAQNTIKILKENLQKSKKMDDLDKKINENSIKSDALEKENMELKEKLAAKDKTTQLVQQVTTKPFVGLKLVHFDLKGAPPKVDYLIKVMQLSKSYGANGFLIEYEDMFPWKGDLRMLAQKNAYSEKDIKHLLKSAKEQDLIVIPLVQSFGHLEFVLKHKTFSHLRANKEITNSVSALNNGSVGLVKSLIDQIIALHPDSKYIHLGGDEVWNMKTCDQCLSSNMTDTELFKHHMIPLFKYSQTKKNFNGEKLQPIIWDDMMRKWSVKDLKEMSKYVTPMVWAYVANLDNYSHFPDDIWKRYSEGFPEIWLASSFKGALKPWSNFVPIQQHLNNHLSWLKITTTLQGKGIKVTGIALTGWSRFDHYGPLCELLPAGIPCLALCLTVLSKGKFDDRIHADVSEKLGFTKVFKIDVTNFKGYTPEEAKFPGADVYKLAGGVENALGWRDWSLVREIGWTRPFHLKRKHAGFFALNTTISGLNKSNLLLRSVKEKARDLLISYFEDDVIDEWIKDKIDHYVDLSNMTIDKVQKIMKKMMFD